jgi:glutamate racemase
MIGIFDSGIGGLTVAYALRAQNPNADFVYFGDLRNAPFGPKSSEELFGITLRAMKFLREQGADEIVAACNSVSVSVIRPLMDAFGIQATNVIEMVGPAARALKLRAPKNILVIATEATVRSGIYEQTFSENGLHAAMMAIPELASAIEQGRPESEIEHIILPVVDRVSKEGIDTLVFGCTHYPFVRNVFERLFAERGVEVELFDPAEAVANEVVTLFQMHGQGKQLFLISKDSLVFQETVKRLFGEGAAIVVVDNTLLD